MSEIVKSTAELKRQASEPFDIQRSIYIFKVGRKTLRLSCLFLRPKFQKCLILKTKKRPHFFLRLEADFFMALKPSPSFY